MGIYGAISGGYGWTLKDIYIYGVGKRFEKVSIFYFLLAVISNMVFLYV